MLIEVMKPIGQKRPSEKEGPISEYDTVKKAESRTQDLLRTTQKLMKKE